MLYRTQFREHEKRHTYHLQLCSSDYELLKQRAQDAKISIAQFLRSLIRQEGHTQDELQNRIQ